MNIIAKRAATEDLFVWDERLIRKYDVPGPRYTSYPTALQFTESFGPDAYREYLSPRPVSIGALSLYVHVPYCRNICYYCACNKIVTRDQSVAERYLDALEKEVKLLAPYFDGRRKVTQLHWGGGTPTFLSGAELTRLMHILSSHFTLIDSADREYSIELDPRSIDVDAIALLKGLGFNRVSMGVQDFDPAVQQAINRIQTFEKVDELVRAIRVHRFKSLSFDLIYGLPNQNRDSIEQTLNQVVRLSPDRISCYSYAHLPERFSSQRSIDRLQIPTADEKLEIFHRMVEQLTEAGYLYVGMDHFVKPDDELASAMHNGTLHRNFQGYSTQMAPELIGIGVSSISNTGDLYAQNAKRIDDYFDLLDKGQLPIERGIVLSDEDKLRREVIMQLICRMQLDMRKIEQRFEIDFATFFRNELAALKNMANEGLLTMTDRWIHITGTGRPLIRNICMIFDAYSDGEQTRFSKTI